MIVLFFIRLFLLITFAIMFSSTLFLLLTYITELIDEKEQERMRNLERREKR